MVLNVGSVCVPVLQIWNTGRTSRIYPRMLSMAFYSIYHLLHYKLSAANYYNSQGENIHVMPSCFCWDIHWKESRSAVVSEAMVVEMGALIDASIE